MDFKQQLREQKLGEVLEFPYELLTTIRFHVRFLNIKLFQEGKSGNPYPTQMSEW